MKNPETLGAYARTLGLSETRLPRLDEFPRILTLKPEILGDFKHNIFLTSSDGRERMQHTYVLGSETLVGNTVLGNEYTAIVKFDDMLRDIWKIYFGIKPLFAYHTHPLPLDQIARGIPPETFSNFSPGDLRRCKAYPRIGFISAVGSFYGGCFLFQTEKSARLPFWPAILQNEISGNRLIVHTEVDHPNDLIGQPLVGRYRSIIQKWGYAAYIWLAEGYEFSPAGKNKEIALKRVV